MKTNVTAQLKESLLSGKVVFATIVGMENDPETTVQMIKELGFEIIIVDCEHSLIGKETIFAYVKAAKHRDLSIWVRPEHKTSVLGYFADSGVCGFMVPQVNRPEDARHAVDQVYFPPLGNRGCGNWAIPYLLDGQDPDKIPFLAATEYMNRNMAIFPQVEKIESIQNLPQILRIEGVTGIIVGSFDLALDMGGIDPKHIRRQIVQTELVEANLRKIAKICDQARKPAGIGGIPPSDCGKWKKEGYQIFILGNVYGGAVEKLRTAIAQAKASLKI